MKKILTKVFHPNKIVGFIIFNISFILLIYVFANHLEDTPIAYISYLLSTYALILFIIWFCKVCDFSSNYIKNTKIYKLYEKNFDTVTKTTIYLSTTLNIGYGIFNLSVGIYYRSFWFITFAVYYFLLSLMRLSIVHNVKEFGENKVQEYRKLKRCGIILLFLNIVLAGIILLIIKTNQEITYSGFIIYIVAIYDFYLIITAIYNAIKYRRSTSPVLQASKFINLTVAMVAMISLEVAMISEFGNDNNFKLTMTGILGLIVTLINLAMAFYMIIKSNRRLKKHNNKY